MLMTGHKKDVEYTIHLCWRVLPRRAKHVMLIAIFMRPNVVQVNASTLKSNKKLKAYLLQLKKKSVCIVAMDEAKRSLRVCV